MIQEILVAGNRGPCGGVNMSLEATNQTLDIARGIEPVYVNHEVVHSKPVMRALEKRGLINVENDWDRVPNGSIMIFSAHGAPPSSYEIAREKEFRLVDVTCQLVSVVQRDGVREQAAGKYIFYIGVDGHPETVGVMERLNPEKSALVQHSRDIEELSIPDNQMAVVLTQTTLSTREILGILKGIKSKFGDRVEIPGRKETFNAQGNLCYATDTRQAAVEDLILQKGVGMLFIGGSETSHNSLMLKEIGDNAEIPSFLIDDPAKIDARVFKPNIRRIGVSSGASMPDEYLMPIVERIMELNPNHELRFLPQVIDEKDLTFALPRQQIEAIRH